MKKPNRIIQQCMGEQSLNIFKGKVVGKGKCILWPEILLFTVNLKKGVWKGLEMWLD